MRDVLVPLVNALQAGRRVAFCQIIATRGSTPQGPGAMMLLEPDGTQVGTLGGGCVEAEIKGKAAGLVGLGSGAPAIFQFTLDHDPAWADGLICGGRLTVLVDAPTGPEALAYYEAYRDRTEAGAGLTEAIALDAAGPTRGDRYLFDAERHLVATLPPRAEVPPGLMLPAKPRPSEAGGWAYLPVAPTIQLVIVGAGHVGQAVAGLAGRVGFQVTVVDDRPEYLTPDRFPGPTRRHLGPIGPVLAGLTTTPETYALIVTRGHGHDGEALGILAPTAAGYVGMIGSRRKVRELFDLLRDGGVSEATLGRINAPVGLEIGSETVDEIAISIVAELIARRNRGAAALADLRLATGRRTAT